MDYVLKSQLVNIAPILSGSMDLGPIQLAEQMFSPNWHYVPTNALKNRKFYELILVDTNSVKIKYYPENTTDITHSTFRIEKILSLKSFFNSI